MAHPASRPGVAREHAAHTIPPSTIMDRITVIYTGALPSQRPPPLSSSLPRVGSRAQTHNVLALNAELYLQCIEATPDVIKLFLRYSSILLIIITRTLVLFSANAS